MHELGEGGHLGFVRGRDAGLQRGDHGALDRRHAGDGPPGQALCCSFGGEEGVIAGGGGVAVGLNGPGA